MHGTIYIFDGGNDEEGDPSEAFSFRDGQGGGGNRVDVAGDKVLYGDRIEEVMHECIELFPHGQRFAAFFTGTGFGIAVEAGNGGKGAFCDHQDFADGALGWLSEQTVAAALSDRKSVV